MTIRQGMRYLLMAGVIAGVLGAAISPASAGTDVKRPAVKFVKPPIGWQPPPTK